MTNPQTVGRYQIQKELGQGGMATVYLAHDPLFERDVALKVMPATFLHDPTFRERFKREAKTIAALEHKAIVPVYDYGEHEGRPYLVMRYMGGGSLLDRLQQGALPLPETARIINRIASALDTAHEGGIVHRDLKPGNILFDQYQDAYLADFGIAKLLEKASSLTGTGLIGTPAYMSPEQAKGLGDLDGRSDIYALGTILFEMLTGRLPYHAETPVGLIMMHISEPVPRIRATNPGLPQGMEAIIAKAMAKDRNQRYQTAGQLAQALNQMAQGGSSFAASAGDETVLESYVTPESRAQRAELFQPTVLKSSYPAEVPADATVLDHRRPSQLAAVEAAPLAAVPAPGPAPAAAPAPFAPPAKKRRKRGCLWLVVGLLVIAGLAAGAMLLLGGNGLASLTKSGEPSADAVLASFPACADIMAPTQAEVMVRFVNESGFEGVAFYEDNTVSPPQLVEYFRVAPGEGMLQESTPGHKWVVQEPSGRLLAEYTAAGEQRQCVLIPQPGGTLWVNFTNQSGIPLIVTFTSADGGKKLGFPLGSGAAMGLWTAAGDDWRFYDGDGNERLAYAASSQPEQEVTISTQ